MCVCETHTRIHANVFKTWVVLIKSLRGGYVLFQTLWSGIQISSQSGLVLVCQTDLSLFPLQWLSWAVSCAYPIEKFLATFFVYAFLLSWNPLVLSPHGQILPVLQGAAQMIVQQEGLSGRLGCRLGSATPALSLSDGI